jgi:hypothetical protein
MSTTGAPMRFHASSATSSCPDRNRLVARIRAECWSFGSRSSARRASRAAIGQSPRSACTPASSRHGAGSRSQSDAATSRTRCAPGKSPVPARRMPSSTRPAHTPCDARRSLFVARCSSIGGASTVVGAAIRGAASSVQDRVADQARWNASAAMIRNGARAGSWTITRSPRQPTITT